MSLFLTALLHHEFLRTALLAGLLASVACGVIGTYVVVRRITSIAGAIAHSVLGGMGAAVWCQRVLGWSWASPLLGATCAGLVAALIIGAVSLRAREREDTAINAIWAIGMAIGILFISRTPGYTEDLMGYLFGNILMVPAAEIRLIVLLDALVVGTAFLFYNQLLAVCLDEEFARLRGVRVEAHYLLLLCLVALTVVLLSTVVGIVMVIALLTLPVAIAGFFSRSLWQMMVGAVLLSVIFTTAGLAISYAPNLPAGATIIVLAGAVYLLLSALRPLVRRGWRKT